MFGSLRFGVMDDRNVSLHMNEEDFKDLMYWCIEGLQNQSYTREANILVEMRAKLQEQLRKTNE